MALPSPTIPLTPVDFCGKQVMQFSEAFWTSTFQNPALNEILTIIPGVKAKQQVVILGLLGLVGKTKSTTQCAPDVSDQEIPSVQKFYDPNWIEDRFVECWKNLLEKFYVWGLKNNIQAPDLTGTDFADFLIERVVDGLVQSIYRIAWFGDKDAAHFEDSGESGHITNDVDIRYFNAINGFWKQFFAIGAANPDQKYDIANNEGVSYAAQKFTAQNTTDQYITGIMQAMVDGMDERLAADPNAKFYVTRSVAQQYMAERRKFPAIDLAYNRQEDGFDTLLFDGYEVVVLKFEDRFIKAYENSGVAYYLPHRIYLTTKENMHLAVSEQGSMSNVEAFYFEVDKQYYIDTLYSMDALVIEDYKVVLAY
jgi:hypothetical protein